jgi:F-type H+-transporting ATPase subunit b
MQFDWWTLALQTINFLIVVWLLSRFLYQPIRRVIEEREAADRKAAAVAEEKARSADEAREGYEAKQADLAKQQREQENRLHAEMDKERQAILTAARKEADALLSDTREKIERERKQALDDLKNQIAHLAHDLALTALGDSNALAGDGLVESVTTHLENLSQSDVDDLKTDMQSSGNGLSIVTASPLSEQQKALWLEAFKARFGDTGINFETDRSILGGAELRFPHAILSFSVADRLRRATDELKD